jgi:hypothetical protein
MSFTDEDMRPPLTAAVADERPSTGLLPTCCPGYLARCRRRVLVPVAPVAVGAGHRDGGGRPRLRAQVEQPGPAAARRPAPGFRAFGLDVAFGHPPTCVWDRWRRMWSRH